MLFNSWEFFAYFPLVTLLYFACSHRFRWLLLLVASCVFYLAFKPIYLLILLFTILVDYGAGLQIAASRGLRRKQFLWASLAANLGVLAVFKYSNFLTGNFNGVAHAFGLNVSFAPLDILLPIGLSFHTFQAMSYTIEVYRGRQEPERHLGRFALFVMFYPQLVAGPIERPQALLPQFREKHDPSYDQIADGLKLMAWGFFKKVVVADRLAVYVNHVYGNEVDFAGAPLWLALYFFSFQIYCDFSGYTDIARGAAEVMGFRLSLNFQWPYAAQSLSDFWKRWHISLSTWFRDYLYIPLGGNRVGAFRRYVNLFTVFVVSGLWHGASWTFVAWGALHGALLILTQATEPLRKRGLWGAFGARFPAAYRALAVLLTFHLVTLAWVFFRADSLGQAFRILANLIEPSRAKLFPSGQWNLGLNPFELLVAVMAVVAMESFQYGQRRKPWRARLATYPTAIRWAAYYTLAAAVVFLGKFTATQFIYFQF